MLGVVSTDLPARSLLCNAMQYNGAYSCWKCLQPGNTASVGKGHCHVFPYQQENIKGPVRTMRQVIQDARQATQNQQQQKKTKTVNGIKGPSWLLAFPRINIVQCIAIDYMHGLLLGVQKLLIRLWFEKTFSAMPFSFAKHIEEVDSRLVSILPTLNITRLPRTIQNHLKYWKASEFRSFLLYYGAPVLYGILDKNRFHHYLSLVNATHILLMDGSSESDLQRAEDMLFNFCKTFSTLYNNRYMTLNIHQLVHLVDYVRELGPLYTHSCFPYEDKNGFVLKLIRGTQNIDSQIITGISFVQKLPELKQNCIIKGSLSEEIYLQMQNSNGLKRGEKITNDVYVVGAIHQKPLNAEEYSLICNFLQFCPQADTFNCYNRLEFCGNLIYGLDYARMKKRNNSAIMFIHEGNVCFGLVKYFMALDLNIPDKEIEHVAIIQKIECKNNDDKCAILSVQLCQLVCVVPLKNIKDSCMFLHIQSTNKSYICRFPNRLEGD